MVRPTAVVVALALAVAGLGAACAPCCPAKEAVPSAWTAVPTGSAAPTAAAPAEAPPPGSSGASADRAPTAVAGTGSAAEPGAVVPVAGAGSAGAAGAAPIASAPDQPPGASSAATAVPVAAASVEPPALLDAAGQPLPQTDARPSSASPWLTRGAALLLEAIVHDDPERARAFFFPVTSYTLVKAIERPAADWRSRLWRLFVRDVHALHQKHAAALEGATLVGVSVPEAKVRWMKPGAEGNKLGYHRVLRARLTFRTAAGEERSVELTSLISWRGEWYLVHLSGFS